MAGQPKVVVLVHGGFVDGSGWEGVYGILRKKGYDVAVVQNATKSLADDVATTRAVIANQTKPVILVGHSYGGAVITEAGNDPKVAALVYITAFAPDQGESLASLIRIPRRARPSRPSCRPRTASCSSTRRSSPRRSRGTWRRTRPPSWPTPKSHGALRRSAGPSRRRHGSRSRAATCL